MALNVTVANLLLDLKVICGYNLAVTTMDTELTRELDLKQKWLCGLMDFSFMSTYWDKAVPAGSRYLAFPTVDYSGATVSINYQRPILVEWFFTNIWITVGYGIGSPEYNYLNSDQGLSQDPIQKWRWIQPQAQFEIWPINATASTLRFTAQKVPVALSTGTDVCNLDSDFLVLSVAVDRLTRSKQADAPVRLQEATERLRSIRSAYESRTRRMVWGQGARDGDRILRKLQSIAVAGN